jgi:hypothetical protein
MGAGFAGDLNRTHPAEIEPVKLDADNPPSMFGQAVILDATSHRARHLLPGDADVVTDIFGCICRPWPQQQETSNEQNAAVGFGEIEAPRGVASAVRSGLLMIQLNQGVTAPAKGSPVFIWCAATSGDHLQGGFETTATTGSTAALDPKKYQFNGGPDSDGIVELSCNV